MADNEEIKSTPATAEEKPKRPRGRPRKTPEEKAAAAAAKPKRPRGRPRKDAAANTPGKTKPAASSAKTEKSVQSDTVASATLSDPTSELDDGTNSAVQFGDTDSLTAGKKSINKPAKADDSNAKDSGDDITVKTEAIIARNSEEKEDMNENDGPGTIGGDDFYRDQRPEKDWGAIAVSAIFLFVYGMIAYLMTIGLLAMTAVRFILVILNEESAEKLGDFMNTVSEALGQIFAYLSGKTKEKPWLD